MTDEQIIEIGKRHFREGHKPEAIPNFVAAVRECLDEARRTVSGQEAQPNWKALHAAADAVAASADIWAGFSTQDAKVCVDAYLTAPTPERADLSPEARAFYARHETRMGRCGPVAPERADADTVGAKLTVWYGPMPESNGKTNWTAILHRGDVMEGITIDVSEYPDRTRYEADRMRWMIGELADEPWLLDYDADKHSGYAATPASQERADAGKDAALLEALRKIAAIENKMYGGDWDEIEEARSIASIAILAANKEAPERAEPRALTDARAKEIAQQVHAECSRIPGATFYNAAMSAIEKAVKERK
jgi:hypothetical protein